MAIAIQQTPFSGPGLRTAEDYLAMPDQKGWELDDGDLVEKRMGAKSGWIGGRMIFLLSLFIEKHSLGGVFGSETLYRCYPGHPNRLRKPDASFIRRGRLDGEEIPNPFILFPPDLAVEVTSPNDLIAEVEVKVREYLEAGVRIVWVVVPEIRSVRIYRADGTVAQVGEPNSLSGEDVLPGFQFGVSELFPQAVKKPG